MLGFFPAFSRIIKWLQSLAFSIVIIALTSTAVFSDVEIPQESDWTDHGVVLTQSASGWDRHFGAFAPATVIKKSGTFFLYYVGASGKRTIDGGPADRALGVATSTDGIHFTKYSGNPILRYQPHNNQEEGIVSAAATLDDSGNIVLYYGAIWAADAFTDAVDVHIRVATSSDGFNFTDLGIVYQNNVENDGENWPHAVMHAQGETTTGSSGSWHVWYGHYKPYSLLMGDTIDNLSKVGDVLPVASVPWFGMQAVSLGGSSVATFSDNPLEVWLTSLDSLDVYESTTTTYNLSTQRNLGLGVILDRDTSTWYLYFRTGTWSHTSNDNVIRLWTAPVRGLDSTPPTVPQNLSATVTAGSQIDLTWTASSDPESAIASYNIYRDGVKVGTVTGTGFSDTGLTEDTTYSYQVSAVNGAGLESAKSAPITATTLADTTPPTLVSVSANADPTQIVVVFSEPVEETSATNVANYSINNNISVSSASLGVDLKTVTLTNSALSGGMVYTLTVNNIQDRATTPNTISPNTQATFTFVSELQITNLYVASGKDYTWDVLDVGKYVYIDRAFIFTTVPGAYVGLDYLKTANNDGIYTENPFISFEVNQPVTVYVAYNALISPKPTWLNSWIETSDELVTTDVPPLRLYKKDLNAGLVNLGGNESSYMSMYSVVVKSRSGSSGTPPAAPSGLRIVGVQ